MHSFSSLTDEQVADQMQRSRAFFQTCLGYVPTVFRPAFGELLPHQARSIASLNQSIVLWNVESLDHLVCARSKRGKGVGRGLRGRAGGRA